ncbi:hypothetical protein Clacol_004306 [Clathrus columnatus]|uniref:Aminoglycoside phosphotransferase domain-containing protein n=1 Tax=Clathrus columnatus TaxID=1419009 RepID=A0AAV5A722_9AGAM|nr:hypothetical protein Clacol_004306 [Clathrus columnatus]
MVESIFSDSQALDLTTADGVKVYLLRTRYKATSVILLTGGFANFTYRVKLQTPFFDPSISALVSTIVLKHAEPYAALTRTCPIPVERQDYEVLAYREVPTIVSSFTGVSLPKVYYEDTDNRVIIMYDCGESCITLKDYLKFHSVPLEVARRIGNSLGRFIGELHVASHQNRPADSPGVLLKNKFERAQELDAFGFFYGVIKRDLPRTTERYDEIIALLGNMHDVIVSSKEVLVMGDLGTGNVLIHGNHLEHLSVIDWEIAKSSLAVAASETNSRDFNKIVKIVALGVGVDLIGRTPMEKPEWGYDERVGEIVSEGISFLLNVENDMWLRKSFLGALYV